MRLSRCRILIPALLCAGSLVLSSSSLSAASSHVVSPAELQQVATKAATTRHENVRKVERFFSSKLAKQTLESAHMSPVQIKDAIPSLSNQELAQLASKADNTQANFAAGRLTTRQVTYVIIAAAIVIIVIAVA